MVNNMRVVRRKGLLEAQALHKNFCGLSRPAFDKSGTQFMFGTENQDNEDEMMNRILLGRIDPHALHHLSRDPASIDKWDVQISSYPINEHVRDVDWLDPMRVVVALNQKLGIVVLGENQTLSEIILFPDFHTDTIRELAVNPKDNHLVISGGFDGCVFVTDISRLVDDIQKNEKKSENSVYLCKDVVGSVSWHPSDHNVASCCTDVGILHVFDIRTDQPKPAFVYDTGKSELFAHAYIDDFTLALGYGDGTIQIHDIRHGKGMISFKDNSMSVIGDLSFAPQEYPSDGRSKRLAVFGVPQCAMWNFNPSTNYNPEPYGSLALGPLNASMTVSGTFVPHTNCLLCTDSLGYVTLVDYSSAAAGGLV